MESPTLRLLGEGSGYWQHLKLLLASGNGLGLLLQDARIAAISNALCVRELWSADRDFSRFQSFQVGNPLLRP